jgi:hypothetical protein
MNVFDAFAINGRWVRLRLVEGVGGRSLTGFVGAVVISGEGSPVQSHLCFENRLSRFSPCGAGSELFLSDIAEVEHVYKSAPKVVHLRAV